MMQRRDATDVHGSLSPQTRMNQYKPSCMYAPVRINFPHIFTAPLVLLGGNADQAAEPLDSSVP